MIVQYQLKTYVKTRVSIQTFYKVSYRYKTTVSSAREKDCAHRNGHGAIWLAVIHI